MAKREATPEADAINALAGRIADRLFQRGHADETERLVMEPKDQHIGWPGYCWSSVRASIADEIRAAFKTPRGGK